MNRAQGRGESAQARAPLHPSAKAPAPGRQHSSRVANACEAGGASRPAAASKRPPARRAAHAAGAGRHCLTAPHRLASGAQHPPRAAPAAAAHAASGGCARPCAATRAACAAHAAHVELPSSTAYGCGGEAA